MRIWDLRTGYLLEVFQGHSNSVYSVEFSADGKSIVSGSLDKTLRIWDISPATLTTLAKPPAEFKGTVTTTASRQTFTGHEDFCLSVAYPGNFCQDGNEWVVSGSKDRHVIFWDGKQNEPLYTLTGHDNSGFGIVT